MSPPLPAAAPVAVIGSGAMGTGIAQVAALAGHPVKLFDQRPGAAGQAVAALRAQLAKLAEQGKLDAPTAAAAGGRLSAVGSLAELADAQLALEAIAEDREAKRQLFAALETVVGPECLFATNTSSISVTAIGAALRDPRRLAGMHFFNPAPLMALVEIVSGLGTAPEVAARLFATAAAWGKTPVHAKSTPGFIVNRLARPYYGEALRLAQEGAADYATLDALLREAGGFRMGPFELMDMIGLDVNLAVTRSVWQSFYHDPRFMPSLLQQELVDAGYFGRKSGRGFYDYRADAPRPLPDTAPTGPTPGEIVVHRGAAAAEALAERLAAAGVAHRQQAATDGRIASVDGIALYVTDGRSASRRAMESGRANLALLDLALDYRHADRLGLCVAAQAAGHAGPTAAGLLQSAGYTVSRLADVPGMAVMRTVAMLANEAADAVNQGVCTAAAADAAMRLGVNYPRGPLAWADDLGPETVRTVLMHLGQTYGEDRYRISPLLQRNICAGQRFTD